jgi:2-haloacid dehalogenase
MPISRRNFVSLAAASLVSSAVAQLPEHGSAGVPPAVARASRPRLRVTAPIKAIAFDALVIFDPRSVFALVDKLFPGRGSQLSNEWRTRQFEYTWLRVAAGRYSDFWHVTQDALVYAAKKVKLELSPRNRDALMRAYLELKAWPDVVPALTELRKTGYRLALLSNFTPSMLDWCIRSAELQGMFEQVLSTDQAKTFKPTPSAYQLGINSLKLRKQEILFAAFAGWDAAGAKLFGYPTVWVNRLNAPAEELGATPDATGVGLADLVHYLKR